MAVSWISVEPVVVAAAARVGCTLAARALGYGTVFITDAISDKITREVFEIPDTYTRVCITPLGIPFEWPKTPPKKELEEFIIREKF